MSGAWNEILRTVKDIERLGIPFLDSLGKKVGNWGGHLFLAEQMALRF